MAGSPAKSLTIPNTVAPPTFRCTSAWRYKSSLDETVEVDSLLEMRPHVAFRWAATIEPADVPTNSFASRMSSCYAVPVFDGRRCPGHITRSNPLLGQLGLRS